MHRCARSMRHTQSRAVAVAMLVAAFARPCAAEVEDPLGALLGPAIEPALETTLRRQAAERQYSDSDFPLPAEAFAEFRGAVTSALERALGLESWVVRSPRGPESPIAGRFVDRILGTIVRDDVRMEVHAVEIRPSGLRVPMVVCLPSGSEKRPGIVVLSGHSLHGLRDLVLDLDSYQRGIAARLARAGFVTVAVEKVDAGYLAGTFGSGSDEEFLAPLHLALGTTTRTVQLQAALVATEILARHPRVDPTRIGATGVSLGGWLAVQTALLNDRIGAVADFGRKTLGVPPLGEATRPVGPVDLCHVLPGLLALGDRNVLALAYAPRPLLAGHGRKDAESSRQGPAHYERLLVRQYAALGQRSRLEYRVHEGGDTMPEELIVDYFRRVLDDERPQR